MSDAGNASPDRCDDLTDRASSIVEHGVAECLGHVPSAAEIEIDERPPAVRSVVPCLLGELTAGIVDEQAHIGLALCQSIDRLDVANVDEVIGFSAAGQGGYFFGGGSKDLHSTRNNDDTSACLCQPGGDRLAPS